MLEDRVLTLREVLAVADLRKPTFDTRLFAGDACLALGLVLPAQRDKYLPLDLIALALTSGLSTGLGNLNAAAGAVRESWEMWLSAVQGAERLMQAGKAVPRTGRHFFATAMHRDEGVSVGIGTLRRAVETLNSDRLISLVSIEQTLEDVRDTARRAGVELPAAFTVQPQDPLHAAWRDEIAAYRARSFARVERKTTRREARERERERVA
jgi:hypothetical protein